MHKSIQRARRQATLSTVFFLACLAAAHASAAGFILQGPDPTPSNAPSYPEVKLPARVDRVEWKKHGGAWTTKDYVLLRELPWQAGDTVTPEDFQLGVDRLRNLVIVSQAEGQVVRIGDENVAVFKVELKISENVVISGQAVQSGAFWLIAGASERNLFGDFIELEAYYQTFELVNGGHFWIRDPRFFGGRTEASLLIESMLRPRPDDVVQHTRVRAEIYHLAHRDELYFGSALEVFRDTFIQPLSGSNPALPSPMNGVFLEPRIRFGRVNRNFLRKTGATLDFKTQFGVVESPDAPTLAQPYARIDAVLNKFWAFGERWNLMFRVMGGITSYVPDQMQYFFGQLDFLRGYPDNYVQAREYGLFNLDLRFTAWERWPFHIFSCQPFIFTDGAAYAGGAAGAAGALSVGGGLLFSIPSLVDSELRLDFSVPLTYLQGAPAFGISTATFY